MYKINKFDIILLIILSSIGLFFNFFLGYIFNKKGNLVIIERDNKIINEFSLNENLIYNIENNNIKNIIESNNGEVFMSFSDCPDQYCVNYRAISKINETIVCLPNKVVISIKNINNETPLYDSISE